MTPTQRGILFQSRHGKRTGLYHAQVVLEVTHDVDVEALRRSWAHVMHRHAALRTCFRERPGDEPVQTVWENLDVPFAYEDRRASAGQRRPDELAALLERDRARGFALDEAPLWRLHVSRLEDARYQILWSFHYILLDARSQARVLDDVARAYACLTARRPVEDRPVTPFREYVDWLGGQDVGRSEDFWRDALRAAPSASPLPVELRPPVDEDPEADTPPAAYAQVSLELDERETAALRAAGERAELTLATLVRGAWAFLLSRYQGTDEVVMGVTTPGRSAELPGVADMVGLLIATLPLRVAVPPAQGWAEWMRGLEHQYQRIQEHEYSPLLLVQQWSGIGSGESLFDTVLTVEDHETGAAAGPLRMTRRWEESHAGYPLSVVATPGERLTLTIHHDTQRFAPRTVERMAGHLREILTDLVRRPQARLGELTLLTPAEFSQLVHEWNDTDAPYSGDLCIHQLFERRVEEAPDALALLFRDERWTYREVNERANQIAHHLSGLGVGRGDHVAILMERSAEMVPALLGILKTGASYVPLDANAPVKRWHWIIDSLAIGCVLTQHTLVPRLLTADPLPNLAHVVCLDDAPADPAENEAPPTDSRPAVHASTELAAMPTANLPLRGSPQDIAYIIFTSGSTGTPKGVTVAHFPAVNLIEWVNNTFSVGPDDRILFITSLTFDLSVYDVFGILAAGGSIRVASGEDVQEPANLLGYLADEPVTFWDSAPAALMQLVPFLPTNGEGAHEVVSRSLRLIFMSGDWIPVHSPDVMKAAFPSVQVVGLGGATEATVWSNFFPIGAVDPAWTSIPYGRPITNARYYVLDESLRPCPIDVPGDLYIGGICLSSCYAREPELTASKYLASPFQATPGARIYKTGDMARWRADGNMEFLGRTDSQVKIRGYRIELGEIDSVLSEHPAVQDAATIVRETAPGPDGPGGVPALGDRSLVSYVVLHPQRAHAAVQGEEDPGSLAGKRIDHWREVYDAFDANAAAATEDGHDFSGWDSSYTGQPIPREEMRAWQEDTVALVAGHDPRAILEIGCGTGLLLFPLAPGCERYYGTDFSSAALASVRGRLDARPELRDAVVLHQREADRLDELDLEPVDTVVINSVIQYFPDIDYLLRVLDGALARVSDGGRIIVGDVRSLPLLDAFHASVEASRAPESMTRQQLWQRVQHRVRQEEELTLDPVFFRDWAAHTGRVSRVEIRPKRGRHRNELSMFRYQVVLHVSPPAGAPAGGPGSRIPELDWAAEALTLSGLRDALVGDRPERLRLRNVPNARVEEAAHTLRWLKGESGLETVEAWRAHAREARGVDPEDVHELAERLGYEARIDWGRHGADGAFTVLLSRAGVDHGPDAEEFVTGSAPESGDWAGYANQPLKAEIQHLLMPRLHAYLAERLPGYMVPSELVALDALPVTSSGKLDRRSLLLPEAAAASEPATRVPPRTTTEALLVSVWEQTLGRAPVGVLDTFFELGGHSLIAVQLVTRIRQVFALEVPVRLFFDLPTIAEVAREVQRRQDELQPLEVRPLAPAPRGGPLPATFDQQRIFFIDRLSPGTTSYTVNWLIPLPTFVEPETIGAALHEMLRRHEPLRTTLHETDGQVWQVVAEDWQAELPVLDLSALPEEECERRARSEIRRWWDQPFDLRHGPLLRARLVRLSETEQVVALGAHHTVFDGYSIGLFGQEFLQICRALVDGAPSPLPDLDVQYADYAVWQQSWLEEDRLAFHLDYWKGQLAEAPEVLALPTDFPRPDERSFRGDFLRRRLSPETTERVAQLSREHQVTNYITMLSSFAVFLSRYSGQDDVVIGVPIANRNRAELESMIGFLVNTVAIRVDLRDDPTFEEVLVQVRRQLFDAQSHQEIPFERIVEALRPTRSLGHNPIFQVMFADESLPLLDHASALSQPQPWMHTLIEEGMSVGVARFDLTLMVQAAPEGMHFAFEYSTDLFEERTVARMADHFETLLRSALANPGRRVQRLTLVEEAERGRILEQGNGTRDEDTRTPAPLPELFGERARRFADRTAVEFGDRRMSYAALDELSNRLAHLLRSRGVDRESLVGLCVPRSLEMVVGQLAILKAGGAYVPLDPSYPRERLAFMGADAGLRVVLAQRSELAALPESDALLLAVEDVWPELDSWPDTPPAAGNTSDDLAYVMYTSGSTGRPKGVAVTHADVATLALDSRFAQGHECVLLHSPQAFDASTYELWAPLLSGGRAVVAPPGPVTPAMLRDVVPPHGITAVFLTTALFHLFAQEDPECLAGLGEVWTGGEPVRAEAVRRVRAACPELVVVDVYGPTETTTFATCHPMEPGAEVPAAVPIGRPLDNMRAFVLDRHMEPVPTGVPGELYLGGVGLARGYLGRPELTAEVFVADPFGDAAGSRLYKTGDLARLRPDGTIEILGRVDDQVKIRGFRVELGEIEAVLAQHPDVRNAVVLLHQDGTAKRLVGYVVSRAPVAAADLRAFLGERLPAYMVPGVFVPLESLPLNPSGKVDRKALAALSWESHATSQAEYVAPRTPVEERLAGIWREVLGLGRPVGVHDSFFTLGGDSILSLQVIFRANQQGLYFTVKQLFQHQTIAELAPVVEQQDAPRVQAEQGLVTGPVELTPIQRWFFDHEFAHPHHLNQSLVLDVDADLTAGQWEEIIRRLLEHHDGLRTRFHHDGTDWHAEITGPPEALPWEVHDLSTVPPADREHRLLDIAQRTQSDLDLTSSPLLRAALFTGAREQTSAGPEDHKFSGSEDQRSTGSEDHKFSGPGGHTHRLLLVAHHLVVDVVSWRVLLEDLGTLVAQLRRGEDLALPPKSSSWQEWAARLRQEAHGSTTTDELAYWQEQTEPAVNPLPTDGPDQDNTIGRSRAYEAVLTAEETRALLQDVPAAFGTRVNDVLLTAVAAAVGTWTDNSHIRVDLEGHGREDLFDDLDVSRTTGWFTTISPLRLPVPSPTGLGEGLKRIKELLRQRPRHGIGYGLLAHGAADTGLSAAAPAQLSFNYLGRFDGSLAGSFAASSGRAGPDWHPDNRRPYLIDIIGRVEDDRLRLEWTYSEAAHHEDTIRRVAEHALDALRALTDEARNPDVRGYSPSDLPLSGLSQPQINDLIDRLRALPAWRAGRRPRPLEDCYPQTPIQQGLWFQSQFAQGEGVYHVQMIHRIEQSLDVDAFRRSWSQVMRRHPILRTSFWTTEGKDALQLVWDDSRVPLQVEDWRAETPDGQRARLDSYLERDRARGFDPHDLPQWRLLLVRTSDESYQLVWSAHHAIIDGWSISLILNDVVRWYGALTRDDRPLDLPPVRPYRDYLAWLQRQDLQQAEDYWRETLRGVEQATPLSTERHGVAGSTTPSGLADQAEVTVAFGEEDTQRLHELAQANRLTLNTVLQGCWALLLGRYAGTDDVVFGTVASGRPSEVRGVERMVGLFINTLPLRVRVPDRDSALEWLHRLQEQNVRMRQFDYSPLGQIQQWSDLPAGAALFETLFVFENYPVDRDDAATLRFDLVHAEERINYPLGVVAMVPGPVLQITVQYDTGRFERDAIDRLLGHFRSICSQIAGDPGMRLSEITLLTEEERSQILRQGVSPPEETVIDPDVDLSAFAAGISSPEERELLERLVAEVQGMSPGDLQAQILGASPATETSENHD
ncbi:amino acid adenylation domain-containing protein [Streptomyces sp. B6B3]|uniref:amino acid adenylation domain-containing protein n=1 Tax=Streptomyces sp. B6B3 TaxID=3153570 RepID=UPI00325DD022